MEGFASGRGLDASPRVLLRGPTPGQGVPPPGEAVRPGAGTPREALRGGRRGKLTQQELSEFSELFNTIDKDGGGTIDIDELLGLFVTLGVQKTRDEVEDMVASMELEAGNEINFEEFCRLMTARSSRANPPTRESLKESFAFFEEPDRPGYIDLAVLREVLTNYGSMGFGELQRLVLDGDYTEGPRPAATAEEVWSRLSRGQPDSVDGTGEEGGEVWLHQLLTLVTEAQEAEQAAVPFDLDVDPSCLSRHISRLLPDQAQGAHILEVAAGGADSAAQGGDAERGGAAEAGQPARRRESRPVRRLLAYEEFIDAAWDVVYGG